MALSDKPILIDATEKPGWLAGITATVDGWAKFKRAGTERVILERGRATPLSVAELKALRERARKVGAAVLPDAEVIPDLIENLCALMYDRYARSQSAGHGDACAYVEDMVSKALAAFEDEVEEARNQRDRPDRAE